jgi:hypothetical protein
MPRQTRGTAVSEHHANLVIRFYPTSGQWKCVVQKVDADGMPIGGDLVTAVGTTKDDARDQAIAATSDPTVQEALQAHRPR